MTMMKHVFRTLLIGVISIILLDAAELASEEHESSFLSWTKRPPMGWNSWDCYGPIVTEKEVKANADYMQDISSSSDGNML